ncbi:ribose-5-phosphate isomerase RpiA [Aquicoccus porphyridii]|uniref:ribose-5-phosphate isomerase RpiA n=1 Tax=Aquicoccus porphyridii TaxID=1852029 RepID=UPI00273D844D|nr:ribose-5-phosphate isomerase RpiA [Aquicoccus porphyridii]
MMKSISPSERAKFFAAFYASQLVESGMRVGLGTGSTAAWLVRVLAARRRLEKLDILTVTTSTQTETQALDLGIPTTTLDTAGALDLTIDGADEISEDLALTKGGGGALLREKIVAETSDRFVVIADPGKQVRTLGKFPLPVEVVRFGWSRTEARILELLQDADVDTASSAIRMKDDAPFVSDEGHYIIDLSLGRIGDPRGLAQALLNVPGVVETGLFVDMAETVVIGSESGVTRVLGRNGEKSVTELNDNEKVKEILTGLDG